MADDLDKDYVCTLDAASIKKAKKELNENPDDRLAAVKAFRNWIKIQPHITWPALDIHTLLVFLRGAKFSQVRARELLEGNLMMREEGANWFKHVDPTDPKLQNVLDVGFCCPLPKRDKEGRQILMQRESAIDPTFNSGYDRIHVMRCGMLMGTYSQMSEMTQVNGSVFLIDFTGTTTKHFSNLLSNNDIQKWYKKWHKNMPGRFKKFIVYNAGSVVEMLFRFVKMFMSKKFHERIVVCDTAESLYEHVPKELLPDEYLPDDYDGPSAGSVKDLITNFKNTISDPEFRNMMLYQTGDAFILDESKRPAETDVPTEHFRKLNVE